MVVVVIVVVATMAMLIAPLQSNTSSLDIGYYSLAHHLTSIMCDWYGEEKYKSYRHRSHCCSHDCCTCTNITRTYLKGYYVRVAHAVGRGRLDELLIHVP